MNKTTVEFTEWQALTLSQPYQHFAMLCGIATGKTFTGAHFALYHIKHYPHLTGFIGANNYDQLSTATLKELFFWLEHYGYDFVIDRMPPDEWTTERKFKKYSNILTVYNKKTKTCTYIFTRVLSDGNPLRGVEFSWYWIDESRDTPQNTHDIILSRLRESEYIKGLVTTTTAGEDWVYQRFVKGVDHANLRYASIHVPTIRSVEAGIITKSFYDTLAASYSPMMAEQELWARHVNVNTGRAYYAFGNRNKKHIAPWGDEFPSRDRPLIIGCDFNFSPAPCMWMVGQRGPTHIDSKYGIPYSDHVHWFGEINLLESSTREMTQALIRQYPDFFYKIYGDASGQRGSTSNAGEYDYAQIGDEMSQNQCMYSIDVDQANPLVKNRVENMNALARNALGHVRMTYNPDTCPMFDADVRMVGWKKTDGVRKQGKLDNGGDLMRTHASDGAGYAMFKEFPLIRRASIVPGIKNMASEIRRYV